MSPRPPKGLSYPIAGLPNPPPGTDMDPSIIKHLRDLNVVLQRELSDRPRNNEVTRLLLLSPNGSLWEIKVADDGTLTTEALFTQP